ncbi:hypothetical protein MJ1HA_1164 [Metallosphaera sedula]|nr:hypothetical protein MJ1HA_1164 [Metallosphaera sedula]
MEMFGSHEMETYWELHLPNEWFTNPPALLTTAFKSRVTLDLA